MKNLAVLGLLIAGGWGLAGGCDNPGADFDYVYCATQLFVQTDKEINDVYRQLVGWLSAEGRTVLRTSQLAWIRSRNQQCTRVDAGSRTVNLDCATRMTQERTGFLKARIRECSSTGCVISRLR
jgi:uncharacterized protein YecT (DUF1311 family)